MVLFTLFISQYLNRVTDSTWADWQWVHVLKIHNYISIHIFYKIQNKDIIVFEINTKSKSE